MNDPLFLAIIIIWSMHGMGFNGSRTWTRFDKRSRMAKVIASHGLVDNNSTRPSVTTGMAMVFVGVVTFGFSKMRPWSMIRYQIIWNMVLEEIMVWHSVAILIFDWMFSPPAMGFIGCCGGQTNVIWSFAIITILLITCMIIIG